MRPSYGLMPVDLGIPRSFHQADLIMSLPFHRVIQMKGVKDRMYVQSQVTPQFETVARLLCPPRSGARPAESQLSFPW